MLEIIIVFFFSKITTLFWILKSINFMKKNLVKTLKKNAFRLTAETKKNSSTFKMRTTVSTSHTIRMYRTVKSNTAEHPDVAGWGVHKGMEVPSSLLTVQKLATTLQIFILCPARSTSSTERPYPRVLEVLVAACEDVQYLLRSFPTLTDFFKQWLWLLLLHQAWWHTKAILALKG